MKSPANSFSKLLFINIFSFSPFLAHASPKADLSSWPAAADILERRCVACHSCNSSPCQIDLGSYDGLRRGGLSDLIYDGTRLFPLKPTRLFIDAKDPREWKEKFDFYQVVNDQKSENSLLIKAVQKRKGMLTPDPNKNFDTKTGLVCPTEGQWAWFQKLHSWRRMPFGFPSLSNGEINTLEKWGDQKFPGEFVDESKIISRLEKSEKETLEAWEVFLNGKTLKEQVTSRYLYEHLFLAHLTLSSKSGNKNFFRLVRSRTATPQEIDEISTRRPFDSPGKQEFYYRLRPIGATIMHKSHIVFDFGIDKIKKFQSLFLNATWVSEPRRLPKYDKEAANPFETFKDMPPQGRYQFFLENADYFVMNFIRGPVCEGQIAVNVIQDHFHVAFLDPEFDLSVKDPRFLIEAKSYLGLPAEGGNSPIETYYETYKYFQIQYLKFRAKAYEKSKISFSPEVIWDGDGIDQDAALTVFRHFDNASVIRGFHGGSSKTVWVMDYPIFERLYYLVVAGFDVFGNVFHQTSTRLYMDNIRVESENNFLYLLPADSRESVRSSWYLGDGAQDILEKKNPLFSHSYPNNEEDKKEFGSAKNISPESIVGQAQRDMQAGRLKKVINKEETFKEFEKISSYFTPFARFLPESMIMLVTDYSDKQPEIFFLSKLTSHKNVAFLFEENERLEPENDRVIVTKDWVGSYPNFLFSITKLELEKFSSQLEQAKDKKTVRNLLKTYGLSRASPSFWKTYDLIEEELKQKFHSSYGRLDLSRYENIF